MFIGMEPSLLADMWLDSYFKEDRELQKDLNPVLDTARPLALGKPFVKLTDRSLVGISRSLAEARVGQNKIGYVIVN